MDKIGRDELCGIIREVIGECIKEGHTMKEIKSIFREDIFEPFIDRVRRGWLPQIGERGGKPVYLVGDTLIDGNYVYRTKEDAKKAMDQWSKNRKLKSKKSVTDGIKSNREKADDVWWREPNYYNRGI
jgi:hypothetical protein